MTPQFEGPIPISTSVRNFGWLLKARNVSKSMQESIVHSMVTPCPDRHHTRCEGIKKIAAFHGTLCRHHVPPNHSSHTRVSLDFRVGIGKYFDPQWQLEGAKAQHTRREITV